MTRRFPLALAVIAFLLASLPAFGQTCTTPQEMDAATKSSIENAATQLFTAAARGDYATLHGSLAPALSASVMDNMLRDNKADLTGAVPGRNQRKYCHFAIAENIERVWKVAIARQLSHREASDCFARVDLARQHSLNRLH